ncbi:THAP domain containing 12a [Pholidichthys leucotaenia]
MQNQCAVRNCSGGKTDPRSLFRFPRDPQRSKKWVEKCQRQDLTDKSPEQLYRFYRLCGKHFETSSFLDSDAQSKVLKDDAVPTIFDGPSQSQPGQGKRTLQLSKENEAESKGWKKTKKSSAETSKEVAQTVSEEDEYKEYLRSLFEVLLLLGQQNIPPTGPGNNKEDGLGSNNFRALVFHRVVCGDETLKKRCEENKCCSQEQMNQMIEVCEKCVRDKLVEEVKQNGFFSLLTEDLVKISGEWYVPVFLRYVDQSNCQRERFAGFLSFEGNSEALADNLLSEMTDKWGLDLEKCRGQAHSASGIHINQMKVFAAKMVERYPRAILTMRSTNALNISLASTMALSGVQLVMSTFKKIDSFFSESQPLQSELENAILLFYPDKEEKANQLKEICRTRWTTRQDAFEVALEILEALLLCVDSVHDNEDLKWNDQDSHSALDISKALMDFEFVMALVVLKNVMKLTEAYGRNLQGRANDVYFAAASVKAVLHSLKEVADNIDVYHEFWNDEALTLAAAMEIPIKVPRSFLRKHQAELGVVKPESFYKEHLSVPIVNHIIREMSELFCDDHLKALRCLSVIPAVIEQHKSIEPDEGNMHVLSNDLPNAGTLSAELQCWWVKWSKKTKGETSPHSLHETLQLADVKFFPNMLAILRLIGILPTLVLEDSLSETYKCFKMYMENTPDMFKSKSLALLSMNPDVEIDLDSVVELYMTMYPKSQESSEK